MLTIDETLCQEYETLTKQQKKCVLAVIAGMKLSRKKPEELTQKEKMCVRVFAQAIKTVRKKTAELQLETVNQ